MILMSIAGTILPAVWMILHICIFIYFIWLAGRLVHSIEKIADKIQNSAKI